MRQPRKRPYLLLVQLIGVLLFVCSCSSTPASSVSHVDGQAIVAPTPTPTPVPPVYTNCPATGTARAAVMPPLPAGGHQAVLYTTDSTSGSNRTDVLNRYDVVTGQKTSELTLTTPPKLQNGQGGESAFTGARISNDGQWMVFQATVEGREAVQLVRVDGQELQTLYCTTTDKDLWGTLSFSPDTKYLTFNELPIDTAGNLNLVLLDLTTGELHVIAAVNNQKDSAVYEPIKWRDNNSIYVNYSRVGVGDTRNRFKVYLLSDVTQNPSLQQINIPTIAGDSNDICKDFDFSPDNTQLLVSDCPEGLRDGPALTGTPTIETVPMTGGTPHVVHVSQHMMQYARFITNTSIWFCVDDSSNAASVWKMNTDGTGLTQLASQGCFFQTLSYASNINISPDGSQFVFFEGTGSNSTVFTIGSMNGGSSKTFTVPGGASLIGWTTI